MLEMTIVRNLVPSETVSLCTTAIISRRSRLNATTLVGLVFLAISSVYAQDAADLQLRKQLTDTEVSVAN